MLASRSARLVAGLLTVLCLLAAGCGASTSTGASTGPTAVETPPQAAGEEPAEDPTDAAADADAEGPLTVYSGRSEELVGPLLEQFTETTGIDVEVRYGDTAEMAAAILEEGANSPADVFFGQDAGALGALAQDGRFATLPTALLEQVDARFRATDDRWVGVSGRARVLAYNTTALTQEELPGSVLDLTDPAWEGRIGWAPSNGSFQAFVTAMRVELGEEAAREWLEGMVANGVRSYEKNTAIVEAVGRGEIDAGLVNHYYLYQFLAEDPEFPVANAFLTGGDIGALVNVAGVGVLETSDQPSAAEQLVEFLLSAEAQQYFAEETKEYPLATGEAPAAELPAIEDLETPEVDLADLADLEGTLELLRETGALTS